MINWHTDRRAKALLAKLNRGNVLRVTRVAIPADYRDYVGADRAAQRTLDALEARRTRAVEREAGAVFTDLKTTEDCRAYLDVDVRAPLLAEVLAEVL